MRRDEELLAALQAMRQGKAAMDLETQTLDFKQEAKSTDDTIRDLVEAAVCFANAEGGQVVLGVSNSRPGTGAFLGTGLSPDVVRRRIYELTNPRLTVDVRIEIVDGKTLLIIQVPQGAEVHADLRGRATRRYHTDCLAMSPAEIARLRDDRLGLDWTAAPSAKRAADVSDLAIATARQRLASFADDRRKLAILSREDLLRALGVVSNSGSLTRAGTLLFCETDPSDASAILLQFKMTPAGEPKVNRLASPLILAFEGALALVKARQHFTPLNLPSGQQVAIEDFPEVAVREALANALIHRDYGLSGPVIVEHSPEVLAVTSPGPLVAGVTPENILTHPSKPRNPSLASAFRLLGLAEEVGRGVDRMFREMIRFGRAVPDIQSTHEHVRVVFMGGAPNANIARFIAQLPIEEREDTDTMLILVSLCANRTITAARLAPVLQKPQVESEASLRRLVGGANPLLEPTRSTARSAHPAYRLTTDVLEQLGTAVRYHRRTLDDIDRKIIEHVREYAKITNRTIQNLLDLDVQRAKSILGDLVDRKILVKTSAQARGPKVEYGPGPAFPKAPRSRERAAIQ